MKRITVGTYSNNDIVIKDYTGFVSRKHAIIYIQSNGIVGIRDISRNGTYVNRRRIQKGVVTYVEKYTDVRFAKMYLLDWSKIDVICGAALRQTAIKSDQNELFDRLNDAAKMAQTAAEKNELQTHPDEMASNSLFSFSGRIGRKQYIPGFLLFLFLTLTVRFFTDNYESLVFLKLAYIPLLWFLIAQSTKRSHDLGKNGWHQIIPLYLFRLLFVSGDNGDNRYGKSPDRPHPSDEAGQKIQPPANR